MKTFTNFYRVMCSLELAMLAIFAFECEGQVLIDDHMESYPTATATSVYLNVAASNPANWQSVVYGNGTPTATAGIAAGNGNGDSGQAAVMTANFAGTISYAGSILNSSSYGNGAAPTQGNSFSDFHFSIDLRGSQAAAVSIVFISMNSSSDMTGTMSKTFTLTAANTYQTFSGNLGEPGWAPDRSKASGAQMDLHAPYYRWSLLIQAENPGGWGFDAGNVVNMDNVNLTSQAVNNYIPVTYDDNGFFHLNSGQSPYVGFKPNTYNEARPISLFVWMHGCGGNAEGDMWSIAPPATRQSQSYIAISLGGRDGSCWNVNTDTPKVLAAITDIARYFNINPRKIYLGGYSSGGDMTYRVGFENASLFAGLLVENSDPFRDTGAPNAYLSVSWKLNIAHLAHLSDTTYPIATVRANLTALTTDDFPVTKIEKAGTHYDAGSGASGTNYDLIHFLLPFLDAGWVSPGSGLPDITVEQADDTLIAAGGTQSFITLPGVPTSQTFKITNGGGASLTGLQITEEGPNASDFTVTTSPTTPIAPGGNTTFTIQFLSNTSAVKSAAIHISNNVTGKNPYDINLTGQALSYSQDTDGDGMSDAAEFQWSSLGFNWQTSQPALVNKFYANATAAGLFTTSQVQALNIGTPLIQRSATTGLFKLTIAVKKTTNLNLPFSDYSMSAPGASTIINGAGKMEFEFSAPDNAAFYRLESH